MTAGRIPRLREAGDTRRLVSRHSTLSYAILALVFGDVTAVQPSPASEQEATSAEYEALPVALDAQHLRTGRWIYQVSRDGQILGGSTIDISQLDGVVRIRASARIGADASEEVLIVLDLNTLAPKTALLSATQEDAFIHSAYEISDWRLRGTVYQLLANGELRSFNLDRKLPTGCFLRGSALALLPAMPLGEGVSFPLYWFESSQALLARALVEVVGVGPVTVPAGEFRAYEVSLKDGFTNMTLHVSTEKPRQVLFAKEATTGYVVELVSFAP